MSVNKRKKANSWKREMEDRATRVVSSTLRTKAYFELYTYDRCKFLNRLRTTEQLRIVTWNEL